MNQEDKQALLEHLLQFVSENKKQKMDKIILDRTRHLTVVLEEIYQSHNASAVLRSAECFGVQDVHVIQGRNRFTAKREVSMGASKWLSINSHETVHACFKQLKKDGYRIVATTPHKRAYSLKTLPIDNKIALVFGTEENGLTSEALELADDFVTIDMYGFTESFNVSVSAAICLHHITMQLRKLNISWQLSEKEIFDLRLQWARVAVKGSGALERRFFGS